MPKGSTRKTGQPVEVSNDVLYADWPPPRRPPLSLAKTFIPLAQRHGGVTIAAITEWTSCPIREAIDFLADLERTGRVRRDGG